MGYQFNSGGFETNRRAREGLMRAAPSKLLYLKGLIGLFARLLPNFP